MLYYGSLFPNVLLFNTIKSCVRLVLDLNLHRLLCVHLTIRVHSSFVILYYLLLSHKAHPHATLVADDRTLLGALRDIFTYSHNFRVFLPINCMLIMIVKCNVQHILFIHSVSWNV